MSDPDSPPARRPARAALAIVYFTVFLDLLGFGIILPFLPYYALTLGAKGVGLGIILTSYSLAQLVGALFLGRISDHFGRRPVLLLSLFGAAAAMVWSGLAETLVALALARGLAGLFGGSITAAQAYVADIIEPEERAKYMGFLGAAIGLGFVVGPAFGVALKSFGLQFTGAAFAAAGLTAANFVFALFRLPESKPKGSAPKGRLGERGWLAMLTARRIAPVLAATFLTTLTFVFMETTFALFGKSRFGMDEKSFGLTLVYVGVVMILVQGGMIGPLSKRFGSRAVAIMGAFVMGASFAGVVFCPALIWAVLILGGLAVGQGFSVPTHATLLSQASGADEQGTILGARQSSAAAARALGPVLAGWLYDLEIALPFLVGGALAGLAGALLTLLYRE